MSYAGHSFRVFYPSAEAAVQNFLLNQLYMHRIYETWICLSSYLKSAYVILLNTLITQQSI